MTENQKHLTMTELLAKLERYGIKSMASLNRAILEQGLPIRAISPRKRFAVEAEIDAWLDRRNVFVAKANATKAKILAKQRKARRDEANELTPTQIKTFHRLADKAEMVANGA